MNWTKTGILPDNFTLSVKVTEDAYKRSAQTSPGITRNETTMAELEDSELNLHRKREYTTQIVQRSLLALLSEPGARFGQGEWVWTIVAQNIQTLNTRTPDPTAVMTTP